MCVRFSFLLSCFLSMALVGVSPSIADEPSDDTDGYFRDVDWAALPTDPDALRDLDHRQQRWVRQAVRVCAIGAGESSTLSIRNNSRNICVISTADTYVRNVDDPALSAFHFGLSPYERYEQQRTPIYVDRLLKRRAKYLGEEKPQT